MAASLRFLRQLRKRLTSPRQPPKGGTKGSIQAAPPITITFSGGGSIHIDESGKESTQVVVTKKSRTGRNLRFLDKAKNLEMTVEEFCANIDNGHYALYEVRARGSFKYPRKKLYVSDVAYLG